MKRIKADTNRQSISSTVHVDPKYPLRRRRSSRATVAKAIRLARDRGWHILFDGSGLPKGQSPKVVIQSTSQRSNDQSPPKG